MTPFEYILPLISVLVGLAVADLAVSLHRLLRARRRVRWDWLPLATALTAVLAVLEVWWNLYATQDDPFFSALGGFLLFAAQLIILFLLNAAALPDEVPAEGLDLRAFYDQNGPLFWSLYAAYVGLLIAVRLVQIALSVIAGTFETAAVSGGLIPGAVLFVLFAALARIRNRAFHSVAVALLLGMLLYNFSQLSLGTG